MRLWETALLLNTNPNQTSKSLEVQAISRKNQSKQASHRPFPHPGDLLAQDQGSSLSPEACLFCSYPCKEPTRPHTLLLQVSRFLQRFLLLLCLWLLVFFLPSLLSGGSSGIYLHNEKREIGKRWGIFLWLRLFVILMFILKDAFQIFKCMCAHIQLLWINCRWHNDCFISLML